MNQEYLSNLNEQQLDAVLCPDDIVFVSAGPGSGKTLTLTSKLTYEIESSTTIPHIVALSYTNTAARELGERLHRKLEESGTPNEYTLFSGTIHSFCYRMLKTYYNGFSQIILDDEELWELAEEIHDSYKQDIPTGKIMDCLKSNPKVTTTPIYETICQVKDALQVMSIQDILSYFLDALDDEGFQQWIRGQVSVVAVDEAQDLSESNYLILDKLIGVIPGLKLFLVGDPRQNIFEFNGGSYRNLYEFLERHPNHTVKTLTITYRCTQAITDYVNTFQFSDCENDSLLPVSHSPGTLAVEPSMSECGEAEMVIKEVLRIGDLTKCAVICNNLKYLSVLIDHLKKKEIPYKVFGGKKLLKKHIRFLNHILRVIDSDNAYSIRKVAQYANIDIVQDGRKKKNKFYESELGRQILAIRESSTFVQIANKTIAMLLQPDDGRQIQNDYSAFLAMSKQYATASDYLAAFATDWELFAQFYEADYEECPFPTDKGYLTLSTIHSAKGLEWENVFIMGLCEGNFPNDYFCQAKTPEEETEFFNGEWKKMYVASTRAKESLHLTYSSSIKRKGFSFAKEPSRFIASL